MQDLMYLCTAHLSVYAAFVRVKTLIEEIYAFLHCKSVRAAVE